MVALENAFNVLANGSKLLIKQHNDHLKNRVSGSHSVHDNHVFVYYGKMLKYSFSFALSLSTLSRTWSWQIIMMETPRVQGPGGTIQHFASNLVYFFIFRLFSWYCHGLADNESALLINSGWTLNLQSWFLVEFESTDLIYSKKPPEYALMTLFWCDKNYVQVWTNYMEVWKNNMKRKMQSKMCTLDLN